VLCAMTSDYFFTGITGFGVKFQEAGGTHLVNMFNTDLGKCLHCTRSPCPPCNTNPEKRDNCRAKNLVYESVCMLCNPTIRKEAAKMGEEVKSREAIYVGEMSRSLHERALEHQRDARDFSQKSHMVKHWMNYHQEEDSKPPFSLRIVKRYKDCLSRQRGEALMIFYLRDQLLNSKSEYVQNCISRIMVNEEAWERKEQERREEEEERMDKERLEQFKLMKRANHVESDPEVIPNQLGMMGDQSIL
jgi:hypothetical protein